MTLFMLLALAVATPDPVDPNTSAAPSSLVTHESPSKTPSIAATASWWTPNALATSSADELVRTPLVAAGGALAGSATAQLMLVPSVYLYVASTLPGSLVLAAAFGTVVGVGPVAALVYSGSLPVGYALVVGAITAIVSTVVEAIVLVALTFDAYSAEIGLVGAGVASAGVAVMTATATALFAEVASHE